MVPEMLHLHRDFDDALPELAPYKSLRRARDLERRRLFVAEGDKVVRRLLESPFEVVSLLLTDEWLKRIQPLLEARSENIEVFVTTKAQIESTTGFTCHQGIKAVGRVPKTSVLDEVLARATRPWLLVAVEGLANAENLGLVVRNSAAFGAQAIIAGETSSSPFLTRAIRCSMGAIFKLPAIETPNLAATLMQLKSRGVGIIAAHPHTDQLTPSRAHFSTDCCIVFGNEGYGLSPAVLALCDELVAIPMQLGVDSLNVGSAAAAFLYEAARQRGNM
jgi:tRNA G18 (ribose-2'-O)-methylase SpoU